MPGSSALKCSVLPHTRPEVQLPQSDASTDTPRAGGTGWGSFWKPLSPARGQAARTSSSHEGCFPAEGPHLPFLLLGPGFPQACPRPLGARAGPPWQGPATRGDLGDSVQRGAQEICQPHGRQQTADEELRGAGPDPRAKRRGWGAVGKGAGGACQQQLTPQTLPPVFR